MNDLKYVEDLLAKVRGEEMVEQIFNENFPAPPTFTDTETNNYSNLAVGLTVYDTSDSYYNPIHYSPITHVIPRPTRDVMDVNVYMGKTKQIRNINDLVPDFHSIVDSISSQTWEVDNLNDPDLIPDLLRLISIDLKKKKLLRVEGKTKMLLSGDAERFENTSRTEIRTTDPIRIDAPGYAITYKLAMRCPYFTANEGWMDQFVLTHASKSIEQQLAGTPSQATALDLEVEYTHNRKRHSFIWSVYRYTPRTYTVTHISNITEKKDLSYTQLPGQISLFDSLSYGDLIHTRCKNQIIDSAKAYRMNEMELINLHVQGCKDNSYDTIVSGYKYENIKSKVGYIFNYKFWNLIITCFEFDTSNDTKYATFYTIIHRTPDFVGERLTRGGGGKSDPHHDSGSRTASTRARSLDEGTINSIEYLNRWVHENVGIDVPPMRLDNLRKRGVPAGDQTEWFVFGMTDSTAMRDQTAMHFTNLTPEEREDLDYTTRKFYSIVLTAFFENTIRMSQNSENPNTKRTFTLKDYIGYRLNKEGISVGVTGTYIAAFIQYQSLYLDENGNKPQLSPALQNSTPLKKWKELWDEFLDGSDLKKKQSKIKLYVPQKDDTKKFTLNPVMKKYDTTIKQREINRQKSRESTGRGGGRGRGRGNGNAGRGAAPPQDPPPIRGGRWGRGRGRGRMHQDSQFSLYHTHDPQSNRLQDRFADSPDDADSEILEQAYNSFDQSSTIHQLQSEIDSLRRSLNQITLIQS